MTVIDLSETQGRLGRKLMWRFSTFLIFSIVIILLVVGGQSILTLNTELKRSLGLQASLSMQSLEQRLQRAKDFTRQLADNRVIINLFVDPEVLSGYMSEVVKEHDLVVGFVATLILSFDGQVLFSSVKNNIPTLTSDFLRPALVAGKSLVAYDKSSDFFIFVEPIEFYKTPQGAVVSFLRAESQRPYLWETESQFNLAFEIEGKRFLESIGELNQPQSILEIHRVGDDFPLLNSLGAKLFVSVSRVDYSKPFTRLVQQILLLTFGLTLLALLLARRFGDRLAKPILKLVDKVKLPVDSAIACYPLGTGDEIEQLAYAFDTARQEMRRTHKELVAAKDVAEKAVAARTEFFAIMSHELRTPMNGVIGMTEILDATDLNTQQRECVETIRSCGELLLTVVNDVLDFSKIESGKIEIESIPIDLRDCVFDAVAVLRPLAESKGLVLELSLTHEVTGWWRADCIRIRQILLNLINNAIKFTEHGRISVRVSIVNPLQDPALVEFRILDTGRGLSEGEKLRLFHSFTQADISIPRRYGGTGLGLAICQRLVRLMGGRIWVESQLGAGASFNFEIPLHRCDEPARFESSLPQISPLTGMPQGVAQEADIKFKPLKILIAEDNEVNQRFIQIILEKLGHIVTLVGNGLDAVEAVQKEKFDLVFMDVQMPEMDGLTAARTIRNMQKFSGLPIIAMTAGALSVDREACLQSGMDDFIPKPIDIKKLIHVLEKISAKTKESPDHG